MGHGIIYMPVLLCGLDRGLKQSLSSHSCLCVGIGGLPHQGLPGLRPLDKRLKRKETHLTSTH
jgi:hypothetical protein